MKLLLDENLPHQVRHEIAGHEVFTVAYMGWSGIDNGKLLEEAHRASFDAIITNDRGFRVRSGLGELACRGDCPAGGREYDRIAAATAS